jgi:hypothetical protein
MRIIEPSRSESETAYAARRERTVSAGLLTPFGPLQIIIAPLSLQEAAQILSQSSCWF